MSHFEDVEIGLTSGFSVPPVEPLHTASFLAADGATFFLGVPTNWNGGDPHTAPRRMVFVMVRGEYEITAGDGEVRRFPPGAVLLLEDTTGIGHSTKMIGAENGLVFAVPVAKA